MVSTRAASRRLIIDSTEAKASPQTNTTSPHTTNKATSHHAESKRSFDERAMDYIPHIYPKQPLPSRQKIKLHLPRPPSQAPVISRMHGELPPRTTVLKASQSSKKTKTARLRNQQDQTRASQHQNPKSQIPKPSKLVVVLDTSPEISSPISGVRSSEEGRKRSRNAICAKTVKSVKSRRVLSTRRIAELSSVLLEVIEQIWEGS